MISGDEVKHIARLSKLQIDDDNIEIIAKDMQKILDYMQNLSNVDTKNIQPTAHPIDIYNIYQEDVEGVKLTNEEVFGNASEHNSKFFLVPKVVDK